MKRILKLFVFLMLVANVHAQVTVSITNMTYINGTPISNCGTIEFGTSPTVRVQFGINLTKPHNQVVGLSHLYVYSLNAYGNRLIHKNEVLQDANFDTTYPSGADVTLNASDYNASGCTLFAVFTTFDNVEYSSCSYNITKTTFSLSPTTVSMPCGDSNARTFTVTPANVPAGATVTYQWNYSGWNPPTVSNTMSSVTLTPISGTSLPSSVTVTPKVNSTSSQTLVANTSRSAYSSSATISGATNICAGTSTYTIGVIYPNESVAWSLTNNTTAFTSNPTNSQVNVTFTGTGPQTLKATITNTCGQTAVKTFVINTNATTFVSNAILSSPTNTCAASNVFNITGVGSDQTVTWSLSNTSIASLSGSTNSQTTVNFTGSGNQTLTALITNTCGQTATKTKTFYIGKPFTTVLNTPSGNPYDQNNLPAGATSGAPYWVFSSFYPEAGVSSYKIINNGVTTYKNATGGNVTLTASELGLAEGETRVIKVTAINSCGSFFKDLVFTIRRPTLCESGIGAGCNLNRQANTTNPVFTIYPNPSRDKVNVDLRDRENFPLEAKQISGELFDMWGISKSKVQITDGKATFSVKGLLKGIYILVINFDGKTERHRIAVE
ncbi:hypothetical protein HYN48_09990 [Flavobacterium magnum]|uniref:Secretion system C-terminal sorting domain-containing protein n=1 Tax=Flavobacterium magnum TaxID=2162713 RepID=A0A2S0RGY3_9FLAO|nr:T9SS type A sorting domain-containing protein [Flavobacterium magnum]AWA30391.1 hypothetical protein HYN48_09990 [Flavobacterium magnum]